MCARVHGRVGGAAVRLAGHRKPLRGGGFSEEEWKGVIGYSAAGLTVGTFCYGMARLVMYRRTGKKVA